MIRRAAQVLDRAEVQESDVPVPPTQPARPTQLQDEVLLIVDVAALLRTSTRTIKRMLRAGTFPIPELLPKIDRRHRWSLFAVLRFITEGGSLSHEIHGKSRLRAVPRKPQGEAARERAGR